MDDEQLNVLKVIEKKPNSNLIDLNNFEHIEDKTNVRVSVLEAFDPLLIKTDSGHDSTQEHKDGKLLKYHLLIFFTAAPMLRDFISRGSPITHYRIYYAHIHMCL